MDKFKKILFFLFAINICYAGTVTDLIEYREYRDFAQNKGKYKVGNTDIVVNRKDGTSKTIDVPMPDFSSTDSNAIGTLVDRSYVAGVKHNGVMTNVKFGYAGGHDYKFIDRNNHPTNGVDRHVPRLNKIVTDAAPTVVALGKNNYKDTYEMYMRVGAGHQYVVNNKTGQRKDLAMGYTYLTGGTLSSDTLNNDLVSWDRGRNFPGIVEKNILPIYLDPGDSGSPLWGYNKNTHQWELIAFGVAGSETASYYVAVDPEFYKKEINKDTMKDVSDSDKAKDIIWKGIEEKQGKGSIEQGDKKWSYDGLKSGSLLANASNEELNFTKHLTFDGAGGTIKLQNHINMGAGKLTFKNNYTIEGKDESISWVGAGIDIAKDKSVTWKVRGQKGDNLHKVGEGTLIVQGTGVNEGSLNVGDGTIILDQKADTTGNKQAFSNIDIVGGKATVVLNDAGQVKSNKVRFMFRGGKLDTNGNNLKFGKIVAYDDGAQIINNSKEKSKLELDVSELSSRPTLYKGHFGEKDKKDSNKIDLSIYNNQKNEWDYKSAGISGGINIDGDIDFISKGMTLVFQGKRDLHADEDVGTAPGKGEYNRSKFKFNNLYIKGKAEKENLPSGFVGGIYSDIEGNIIIEDSSSAVIGYVNDKWTINIEGNPYEYGKTILLYDLNDQKSMNDSVGKIELNNENINDIVKKGTTTYNGSVKIKENGTLDVGATNFSGEIEALNSGRVSMANSKIDAKLNIGDKVTTLFKNIEGNLKDSTINNSFDIKEKSNLVFNNLALGNTGKLNIDNSIVKLENSKAINGDISASNNSEIKVINSDMEGNIKFVESNLSLSDSNLTGILNSTGDVELKNSTWNIKNNSDISNLKVTSGDIKFISRNEKEFSKLSLNNLSGDSKLTFNTNLASGESDKLEIKGDIPSSFETEIAIKNVGSEVKLNKEITVIAGKENTINKIKVKNSTVDLGVIQGKVEVIKDGGVGIKPSAQEEKVVEEPRTFSEVTNIVLEIPSEINKDTAGSTTTVMLNEYAARMEAIKNQNNLFKSEINFAQDEGVNYIGNTQYGRYESDKFREYSQTIINNGFIYKTNDVINNKWNLSKGIGFNYGKSIIDYEGDYTGRIDNYGVHGYLQFLNKAGYYIAPNIGLTYNENKINSEKFYTTSQSIGVKLGYQKELENNLNLIFETGIDMYHISSSDYNLDFKNSKYSGNMDGKYFVEIKPEVKVSKEIELGNNKTSLYTGVGLEYNKYVFEGEPVVNIVGDKHQVETAMIDKGTSIKAGVENSYKNIDLALEAEYFTGKYNNEKIKGNIKVKYRF